MTTIKVACVGDIMCGDSFYALGTGAGASIDRHGDAFMPESVRRLLSGHDVVLGNVECPLSDMGRRDRVLRTLHMRGRAHTARHLAAWGLSVANLANNHILEHGREVAADTARNLEAAGIAVIGTGPDGEFGPGLKIVEKAFGDTILAFLGICLRREKYAFDGGGPLAEVLEAVRRLCQQARTVCVSIHWGDEFIDRPSVIQRRIAESIVEAGALLVAGNHPHVVQGVESLGGSVVAYSLGNFIFDGFLESTRWSFILRVEISGRAVSRWECIPVEMDGEHRPQLALSCRETELRREIERRCALLSGVLDDEYQQAYVREVALLNAQFRKRLRRELLRKCCGMHPAYWPQILYRPIQRRLGRW